MSKGADFPTHCSLNLDGKNRMSTFVCKDMTPLSVIMLNQSEHKMLLYTRIQKSKDQIAVKLMLLRLIQLVVRVSGHYTNTSTV